MSLIYITPDTRKQLEKLAKVKTYSEVTALIETIILSYIKKKME